MKKDSAFDQLYKSLFDSKRPEYFFGGDEKMTLESYKKIRDEKFGYFEKVANAAKNRSKGFQISLMRKLFSLLDKWAQEKIKNGSYGNTADYRLKIVFEVRKHGKEKHFFLRGNDTVHSRELKALCFSDGYGHTDAVAVIRDGVPVKTGYIREYGTHAAMNCFFMSHSSPISFLKASDYKPGDLIEIETWDYSTLKEFVKNYSQWLG